MLQKCFLVFIYSSTYIHIDLESGRWIRRSPAKWDVARQGGMRRPEEEAGEADGMMGLWPRIKGSKPLVMVPWWYLNGILNILMGFDGLPSELCNGQRNLHLLLRPIKKGDEFGHVQNQTLGHHITISMILQGETKHVIRPMLHITFDDLGSMNVFIWLQGRGWILLVYGFQFDYD